MKPTNNLQTVIEGHFSNGDQYRAKLRLNDECGNGHEDFSITGDIWGKDKPKTEKNLIHSGAIGDKLAGESEIFALFNDLHLCDSNGIPMFCTANMFFHLQNEMSKEKFCSNYRITDHQYNVLSQALTQNHFLVLFTSMPEILEHWKGQANEAIKYLEAKTGKKFESKAVKSNLRLPENMAELKELAKEGHFEYDKVKERTDLAETQRRKKKIEELQNEFETETETNRLKKDVKIALIEQFGTHDNVIFYSHKPEIVFNWERALSLHKEWTDEEIEQFKNSVNWEISNIPMKNGK